MRFMMLMIPRGYEAAAPGTVPSAEAVTAMMKYNETLKAAGVLITLDGLHPPSAGARVSFAGGKPVVTDGPFIEAKEVLGGYWDDRRAVQRGSDRLGPSVARVPTTRPLKFVRCMKCRISPPTCSRPRPDLPNCRATRTLTPGVSWF